MDFPIQLIDLISMIAGAGAGAGAVYAYFKKQLQTATQNLTVSEVLEITFKLNQAIDKNSPGGPEITDAEAQALGRAIWTALKT